MYTEYCDFNATNMNSIRFPTLENENSRTWIYPTNYPIRNYQREICEAALFQNTLVCLPTGLGKTLIAAVIMYNFNRWYPNGKIVFVAPTKPLVTQQVEACYNIVGIPEEETAHLDGHISSEKRVGLWKEKNVFFCTPQIFANDLKTGVCEAREIVCVIVDEAHKATSGYAYTIAIEELSKVHNHFRVLALSATPGSEARKIQNVSIFHIPTFFLTLL
jgi:ERCC4-related helicase